MDSRAIDNINKHSRTNLNLKHANMHRLD